MRNNGTTHTIDKLRELWLRDGFPAVQANLDIVSMPIGAEVSALVLDINEYCTETDIARARTGGRLSGRGRSVWARWLWRLRDLIDDVARNKGIKKFSGKREDVVLVV